jgi:2-haloalkanoic acid dehalogenase type II
LKPLESTEVTVKERIIQKSYHEVFNMLRSSKGVPMLSAVLFDLGGTLVYQDEPQKVREASLRSLNLSLRGQGHRIELPQMRRVFDKVFKPVYSRCEQTDTEVTLEEPFRQFLAKLGIQAVDDPQFIRDAMADFLRPEIESWKLYPDTIMLLSTLKDMNLKVGLVSNASDHTVINVIIDRLNIARFFDAVVTSAQLKLRKPKPEIFKKALESLRVNPSEVVMVGDTVKGDVGGAKNLGMKAILVRRAKNEMDEGPAPDAVVENLAGILPVIKDWLGR